MKIREVLQQLKEQFPEDVLDQYALPLPWCVNKDNVKAILLGCDPSNKFIHDMPYVFALGADIPRFNAFKNGFEKDLVAVGLSWDTVYVQNLCRNYFRKDTAENKTIWLKAAKYWIQLLKEELSIFDPAIPILLTSDILFKALVIHPEKYGVTIDFYEGRQTIPILAEDNRLERPLVPFFRGRNGRTGQSYRCASGNWEEYREQVESFLNL